MSTYLCNVKKDTSPVHLSPLADSLHIISAHFTSKNENTYNRTILVWNMPLIIRTIVRKSKDIYLNEKFQKKFGPFLDLCVSSLRRGHANLLCIVPILSDVPEGTIYVVAHFIINKNTVLGLGNVGLSWKTRWRSNVEYMQLPPKANKKHRLSIWTVYIVVKFG